MERPELGLGEEADSVQMLRSPVLPLPTGKAEAP